MIANRVIQCGIIGIPIFLIIFLVIWTSLKSVSFLGKRGVFLISICVAILCLISMFDVMYSVSGLGLDGNNGVIRIVSSEEKPAVSSAIKPEKHDGFRFILLPYFVLLITVLGSLLIWLLAKVWLLCNIFVPSSSSIQVNKKSELQKSHIQQTKNTIQSLEKQL